MERKGVAKGHLQQDDIYISSKVAQTLKCLQGLRISYKRVTRAWCECTCNTVLRAVVAGG